MLLRRSVFAQQDGEPEFAAEREDAGGLLVVQGLERGLELGAHALGVHAESPHGFGSAFGIGLDGARLQVGNA